METQRRKPGRPRATQRTLPLVLDTDRSLEKLEVAIPESTAKALAEYAAWVRQCRDMTVEEATTSTIDYALREVFRRDRLWRDRQRKGREQGGAAPPPTAATRTTFPTALPEPRPSAVASATPARSDGAARVPPPAGKP
jgi:hypothetical protein